MKQKNPLRYSILKLITRRPDLVNSYIYYDAPFPKTEESQAFRFGSAVDTLLTTDNFWLNYQVTKSKAPPPMMINYINELVATGDSLAAYRYSRYKININKVEENLETLYKDYYLAKLDGKTMISEAEFEDIQNVVEKIDKSPFKTLFTNPDNIHQLLIKFDYRGFECSGTLDILEVDKVNKTLRVVDLKTTKDVNDFEDSYYLYKYYRQGTYYTKGIEICINNPNDILYQFNGYEVLPPAFITVDKFTHYPLLYEVTEKYRGLDEIDSLLDLFKWHVKNKVFVNKEHYENKFIIKI